MRTRTNTLKNSGLVLTAAMLLLSLVAVLAASAPSTLRAASGTPDAWQSIQNGETPPSPVLSIDGLYDRPGTERLTFIRDFRWYVDGASEDDRNAFLDRVFGDGNWVLQVRISGNIFQKDGQSGFYKWGDLVCEFIDGEESCYNVAESVSLASDLPKNYAWLTLGAEFRERDFTESRRYCKADGPTAVGGSYLLESCIWM